MSADLLRQAAAGIREDVAAMPKQTPTPLRVKSVAINSRTYLTIDPDVALAVADWLDGQAGRAELGFAGSMFAQALVVATTYLGDDCDAAGVDS